MSKLTRRPGLLAVGAIIALTLSGSVLAASPEPSSGDSPGRSREAKEAKADKGPELTTTVTGTVVRGTDDKGRPSYSLTAGGTTWELSAGPPWFWGADSPLEASVGTSVTVVGTYHEGSTDLSVDSIDGTAIRAAGKPPWAGGPKSVGERHPGWKGADHPGQGRGRESAPGQQRQASPTP
jgi:hypothetical protein